MKKYLPGLNHPIAGHHRAHGLVLLAVALLWAIALNAQAATKPVGNDVKAGSAPRHAAGAAKPLWHDLSATQRDALAPLAGHWDSLSSSHKRRWIALSKNFRAMPLAEQTLLHTRMNEWVLLSPLQRRTARLNFAETKRISSSEKQRKWEAYQALPPAVRHSYTESAAAVAPGMAGATSTPRPVSQQRLATVPVAGPGIAVRPKLAAPNQIDPHTLLPHRSEAARGHDSMPVVSP